MAIEVFNRYEHKYLLNAAQYKRAIAEMDKHMELDAYNKNHEPYMIANIYFDTESDYLIRKSLAKPEYKEKLRLRAYGVPQKGDKVFLEIKKKVSGIVNKRRTVITLGDAFRFAETGIRPIIAPYMNKQVIYEREFFINHYKVMPKLYLAYDRIAYFEKGNPDLRISFDMNIRSRRYDLSPDLGDYGEKLLPDGMYLMEIKTAVAKPLWLTNLLTEIGAVRNSFSKYGTEYKNYLNAKNERIAI